ncbi:hypothetical protein Aperf_G00000106024 [Anoplocephala perfoliata]
MSSAGESHFSHRRLTTHFKFSFAPELMNLSTSTLSKDSSTLQPRKAKRRTLMPRIFCNALEKSAHSEYSVDLGSSLKVPWSEWRRRRPLNKTELNLPRTVDMVSSKPAEEISESWAQSSKGCRMQSRQTQTEALTEDEVVCKENVFFLSSASKSSQKHAFSCSRKSLPLLSPPRELAFKRKRSRERSLDNDVDPIQSSEKDSSKLSFLPTLVRRIASVFNNRKKGEDELARRVAAALNGRQETSVADFSKPGSVFGTALEDQIPSPDHPNVPLILFALVTALELHGLHHVGLYRVPGRQRETDRFVYISNLTSLHPHFMTLLPTWNDVRALTGVIKVFLRRLPRPICDPNSWKSLANALPDESEQMTTFSLVSTLYGIRSELFKSRYRMAAPWLWRYATLDYLFGHLRRVVALEEANNCNFKCIAICLGPSLFNANSQSQGQFNVLLEIMLQHWIWLRSEVTKEFPSSLHQIRAYVKRFHTEGPDLSEEVKTLATMTLADSGDEVIAVMRDIFERAAISR